MIEAGIREFGKIETPGPLHGYGDLSVLDSFDIPLFLVTSGFRKLQESKVRALGIVDHFLEVVVDAIDEPETRIKKRALSKESWILTDFRETESWLLATASIRNQSCRGARNQIRANSKTRSIPSSECDVSYSKFG